MEIEIPKKKSHKFLSIKVNFNLYIETVENQNCFNMQTTSKYIGLIYNLILYNNTQNV